MDGDLVHFCRRWTGPHWDCRPSKSGSADAHPPRWLALALREHGVNPADVPDGPSRFPYSPTVGNPGPTTQLPIGGHVLTAMLQHDLAVLPQQRWPKQPRLRLAVSNAWGHEQSQLLVDRFIGRMRARPSAGRRPERTVSGTSSCPGPATRSVLQ